MYVTDFYTVIMYVNSYGSFKIYIPIKKLQNKKSKIKQNNYFKSKSQRTIIRRNKVEVSKKTEMNINDTL